MNPPYQIMNHDQATVVTLDLVNLDGGACMQIRGDLFEKLKDSNQVVMDVHRVQFADTSGLGMIRELASLFDKDCFALSKVSMRLLQCLKRIPKEKIPPIFDQKQTNTCAESSGNTDESQNSNETVSGQEFEKELNA